MTGLQLRDHLKTVHGIEPPLTGKKSGRLFLDMDGGQYTNIYDWIMPGDVKITESAKGER